MADFTLDDYIQQQDLIITKRVPGMKPQNKGNIKNRLGLMTIKSPQTNVDFQKKSDSFNGNRFQNLQNVKINFDARQKIGEKTNMSDARIRIVNSKQKKGTFDAREKLQIKKMGNPQFHQQSSHVQFAGPQVIHAPNTLVTGPGSQPGNQGPIFRTINTDISVPPPSIHEQMGYQGFQITRTVNQGAPPQPAIQMAPPVNFQVPPSNMQINTDMSIPPPNIRQQMDYQGYQITRTVNQPPSQAGQFQPIFHPEFPDPYGTAVQFQTSQFQHPPPAEPVQEQMHMQDDEDELMLEEYEDQDEEDFGMNQQPETFTIINHAPAPVRQPPIERKKFVVTQTPPIRQRPIAVVGTRNPAVTTRVPIVYDSQQPASKIITLNTAKRKPDMSGPLQLARTRNMQPKETEIRSPVSTPGGPLQLARTRNAGGGDNGMQPQPSMAKKIRLGNTAVITPPHPQPSQNLSLNETQVLSPLQGYRIIIANLNPVVSQDDIIELFGAIGPMKKARLVKPGVSEVVYVKKEDAIKALQKYHNRELDGQAMSVKLLTSTSAPVKHAAQPANPQVIPEILKSSKDIGQKSPLDSGTLHKALFKTGTAPTNPVVFTVKI